MAKKLDPAKHDLVPKHVLLSDKEKDELFAHYQITIFDLPRIEKNDAAIGHLSVKTGDVIKIIKKSKTAKEAVYYRGI